MSTLGLPVAVRGCAVPDYLAEEPGRQRGGGPADLGPSEWSITFDTETLAAELGQGLRIVVGQVRHGDCLTGTVIGYEPEVLSEKELKAAYAYAADRDLRHDPIRVRGGCLLRGGLE